MRSDQFYIGLGVVFFNAGFLIFTVGTYLAYHEPPTYTPINNREDVNDHRFDPAFGTLGGGMIFMIVGLYAMCLGRGERERERQGRRPVVINNVPFGGYQVINPHQPAINNPQQPQGIIQGEQAPIPESHTNSPIPEPPSPQDLEEELEDDSQTQSPILLTNENARIELRFPPPMYIDSLANLNIQVLGESSSPAGSKTPSSRSASINSQVRNVSPQSNRSPSR